MFRQALADKVGHRDVYTGIFVKQGMRHGRKGPVATVLLKNLKDSGGQPVCDHLYFTMKRDFWLANMIYGDKIRFVGKVEEYERGHFSLKSSILDRGSVDF